MPIQLPVWTPGPIELIPQVGPIDAEAELKGGNLATTFLRICGVRERWIEGQPGEWASDHAEMRANVEAMILAIKKQTIENVRFHDRALNSVQIVERFLKQ